MPNKYDALISLSDNTFTFYEEINGLDKYYIDKDLKLVNATIEIHDPRTITSNQRNFIYAVLRDIATFNYMYCSDILIEYYKGVIKGDLFEKGIFDKYISFSNCSISEANIVIDYLLTLIFDFNIPIRAITKDMLHDEERWQYHCIVNKKCCICGKQAEIHHYDSIGMGNNRKILDDSDKRKMALCRKHHTESHAMTRDKFCEKYHVKPIKLTKEQIKELGI